MPPGKILAQNSLKSRRCSGVIFLQPWHPPPLIFYLHMKLIHFQSFKSDIPFQSVTQQILFYIYYIPNMLLHPEDTMKNISQFLPCRAPSILPFILLAFPQKAIFIFILSSSLLILIILPFHWYRSVSVDQTLSMIKHFRNKLYHKHKS